MTILYKGYPHPQSIALCMDGVEATEEEEQTSVGFLLSRVSETLSLLRARKNFLPLTNGN